MKQSNAFAAARHKTLEKSEEWLLVQRIVASPGFARSSRLAGFLMFVSEKMLLGQADEISEHEIGVSVFQRSTGYSPIDDSIVRSHARLLRRKLEFYFENEGREEGIVLIVPKGGYIPAFRLRERLETEESPPSNPIAKPPALAKPPAIGDSPAIAEPPKIDVPKQWRNGVARWLPLAAALVSCCLAFFYLGRAANSHDPTRPNHPLWSRLFPPDRAVWFVAADSGLVMFQNMSRHPVKLFEYTSKEYGDLNHSELPAKTLGNLGLRRYTSIVDLLFVTRLQRLPQIHLDKLQIRYARDLQLSDMKGNNLILSGAREANPWVELFEKRMNFSLVDDQETKVFHVMNAVPSSGERPFYLSDPLDPAHKVYGILALMPGLNGSGEVLIVEGTSMAGTEAAADFALDDDLLLPALKLLQNRDGSLPFFEMLFEASSLNAQAPRAQLIAWRVHKDLTRKNENARP